MTANKLHTHSFSGFQAELHPATDRWMMGDRWGTIQTVNFDRGTVRLKMRTSGKTLTVSCENLMPRESVRQLFDACGKGALIG